jgi:aryl carrier-like protein
MLTPTILLLWRTLVKISLLFVSLSQETVRHDNKEVLTTGLDPINLMAWISELRPHRKIDNE